MGAKPATFDFLGFTHICERGRRGAFRVGVRTAKKRLKRSLHAIAEWCKEHRHDPIEEQQRTLNAKLQGHYQYYGRSSNFPNLARFYRAACRIWRQWLSRRTRGTPLPWDKYNRLLQRFPLAQPRITHTWASLRSS